jgi:hypothetical protein
VNSNHKEGRWAGRFKEPAQAELPEAPRPDASTISKLISKISKPSLPQATIEGMAEKSGNQDGLKSHLKAMFESDQAVAEIRWLAEICKMAGKAAKLRIEEFLARKNQQARKHPLRDFVKDVRLFRANPLTVAVSVFHLVWNGLLFLANLVAEFVSAVFLVQMAGIGFEGQLFYSLCFVISSVIGPYATLKFIESICDEEGKKRYRKVLAWLAGISAILCLIGFTATLGMAAHAELNALGSDGLKPAPALWPVFLLGALVLATCLAMQGHALRLQLDTFFTVREENNVPFSSSTRDGNFLSTEHSAAVALIELGESADTRLDNILHSAFFDALVVLEQCEKTRRALRAQIDAGLYNH